MTAFWVITTAIQFLGCLAIGRACARAFKPARPVLGIVVAFACGGVFGIAFNAIRAGDLFTWMWRD